MTITKKLLQEKHLIQRELNEFGKKKEKVEV